MFDLTLLKSHDKNYEQDKKNCENRFQRVVTALNILKLMFQDVLVFQTVLKMKKKTF